MIGESSTRYSDRLRNGNTITKDWLLDDNMLVPGMLIGLINRKYKDDYLCIAWVDPHRDDNVVVYDIDGHSEMLKDVYSGKYQLIIQGYMVYKVLYGTIDKLFISDDFYPNINNFKIHQGSFDIMHLIGPTGKYIYPENQ